MVRLVIRWFVYIVIVAVFVSIVDPADNADPVTRFDASDLARATEAERGKVRELWFDFLGRMGGGASCLNS